MSSVYLQFEYSRACDFCEDPDPDLYADMSSDKSVYNFDYEDYHPSSSRERKKRLTRRQRKNRHCNNLTKYPKKWQKSRTGKQPAHEDSEIFLTERVFIKYLRTYVMEYSDLVKSGYPYQSPSHANKVCFWENRGSEKLEVNAQELVPGALTASDTSSGSDNDEETFYRNESRREIFNSLGYVPAESTTSDSSSDSDSDEKKFYPNEKRKFYGNAQEFVPEVSTTNDGSSDSDSNEVFFRNDRSKFNVNAQEFVPGVVYSKNSDASSKSESSTDPQCSIRRTCTRCQRDFFTTTTEYLTQQSCFYHWGKLGPEHIVTGRDRYACCQGLPESPGCTTAPLHVWNGIETINGLNGPYTGYVRTSRRKRKGIHGVFAIDCEMSYTVAGLEATKVTVVGMDGLIVYDRFVLPENKIIDYNTRISEITAENLEEPNVTTLKQVQKDLRKFIFSDTILIGHGFERNLRALKLTHTNIVDTSIALRDFPGAPWCSLKTLARLYLNRDIQESGHSTYEDALACMQMMYCRVLKKFIEPNLKGNPLSRFLKPLMRDFIK